MAAARGKIGFCEGKRRLRLLDGVQGGLGGAIYRGRGEALGVRAKAAAASVARADSGRVRVLPVGEEDPDR